MQAFFFYNTYSSEKKRCRPPDKILDLPLETPASTAVHVEFDDFSRNTRSILCTALFYCFAHYRGRNTYRRRASLVQSVVVATPPRVRAETVVASRGLQCADRHWSTDGSQRSRDERRTCAYVLYCCTGVSRVPDAFFETVLQNKLIPRSVTGA